MEKKTLFKSLGVSMLGASVMLASQQALAVEDEGCTFVLCIAAPNPMGIAACAPTVKKVLKRIAQGKAPPVCKAANGEDYRYKTRSVFVSDASQIAKATSNPPQGYDAVITQVKYSPFSSSSGKMVIKPFNCPKGYRNGEDEIVYHQGKVPFSYNSKYQNNKPNVTGGVRTIGDSENGYEQRVCVGGNQNGTVVSKNNQTHTWFDKVTAVTGDDANSGISGSNVFDIFFNGQHRVVAW